MRQLLLRSMGRRTRSQKAARSGRERVWSIQTPISWKLPATDNSVFKFNDRYAVTTITTSTVMNVYGSSYFYIGATGNATALTSLFDQYRITRVEVMFVPQSALVSAGATATSGMLHTVVDYDDASNLTSEQAALSYQNCLSSSAADGHFRDFQPHCAVATYQGALTAFSNVKSPWIDASFPNVQHYGVKWVGTIASTATEVQVYATLFTEWRNVR